jgi:biotin carboxyl carrier protein
MEANKNKGLQFDVEGLGIFSQDDIAEQEFRVVARDGNHLKIQFKGRLFDAVVRKFDAEKKEAHINVSGMNYTVRMREPLDQLVGALGFLSSGSHSVKEINSPMPGLVVDMFAEIGQAVSEGDKLLSLEAMKMENIIKSPGNGIIKEIHISKGQAVEKNQKLIEFE